MSCSKRILVKCLSIFSLFLLFSSCSFISDLLAAVLEEETKTEESPDSDDSSDQNNPDDSSKIFTYFDDYACTLLKSSYAELSDDELSKKMKDDGINDDLISIALKIKNDDWQDYEKEFRIHEYKAYSDASYWNGSLKTWGGSYMGNPTGIYSEDESPLYVFVDSDIPDDASLYFASCLGNKLIYNSKTGSILQKGMNKILSQKDALYYVLYIADTKSKNKTVSEWPAIKIHVEGGLVNGYYDVTRHSDSDYVKLLENASFNLFTVKGEESLFNFKTETYRNYWPQTIEDSIRWFDGLYSRELELSGICQSVAEGQVSGEPLYLSGGESIYPLYYNNPSFAIEGEATDPGYANASNYRTSYNSSGCCSKSFDVNRSDFDDWCAAHECGHLNQSPINLEGCGEVSNNLFSNVIRFSDGITTSSGSSIAVTFNDYANHTPFFTRDIWSMTRMYYQLYLYYHLAQKNTSFYPELFNEFRQDPMELFTDANLSSLKFVRKVCKLVQEDLTEFFTAWGFFEACRDLPVGNNFVTVRQEDIDSTLAEISKYPKKNRQILFIEDRVQQVPTSDFLWEAGNVRSKPGSAGQYGDLGQFSDYIASVTPSSYTYIQLDSIIAMEGSGGVGFEILDSEGKLVFGSNSLNFTLPDSLGNDVLENLGTKYKIYSVDADGTLHEARKDGQGYSSVEVLSPASLSSQLDSRVIKAKIKGPLNGSDIKYLRELINEGNLVSLNLEDASFVSGGDVYYTKENSDGSISEYRCLDNEISDYSFVACTNLKEV